MVSADHKLSMRKQCALLRLSRAGLYYHPVGESLANLKFMEIIDKQSWRRRGTDHGRWRVLCSATTTDAGDIASGG